MSRIHSAIVAPRHIRCFFVAWFCVLFFLSAGCETEGSVHGVPLRAGRFVNMELSSNVPNSQFSARKQRLGAGPDEGWDVIGSGTRVTARFSEGVRYEIAVKPEGYRERRVKFTEPIKRYEFRFVGSDRLSTSTESPQLALGTRLTFDQMPSRSATGIAKKWAVGIDISVTWKDKAIKLEEDQ